MKTAKESDISEESTDEFENELTDDQFNAEDAAFVMDTASEAIALLAHYNSDFTRAIDRDYVSSYCRIIAEYLCFHASLLNGDMKAV